MKATLLGICTLVLLAGADDPKQADKQKELERLKGTWNVVSMVLNGQDDPNGTSNSITFNGENVTIKEPSRDSKGKCALDLSKDPKHIDLTPDDGSGRTLLGIYALKDDELKLCIARPDAERPTQFESKEGSNLRYVVLKRMK
jgi:uncharacterized protein (TIGR03067 family)